MEIIFKIQNDGSPPLVNIDGKRLAVVQLTYAWRTKNIDPDSGTNICIIDGFFEESNILQRFVYDIKDNIVTEVPLKPTVEFNEPTRIFEIYVALDKSRRNVECSTESNYETEKWIEIPFFSLQVGDIIRIKDGEKYIYHSDDSKIWVVMKTPNIANGIINVLPYTEYLKSLEEVH